MKAIWLWFLSISLFVWGLGIVIIGPLKGQLGGFHWGVVMLAVGGYGIRTMWATHRDMRRFDRLEEMQEEMSRLRMKAIARMSEEKRSAYLRDLKSNPLPIAREREEEVRRAVAAGGATETDEPEPTE